MLSLRNCIVATLLKEKSIYFYTDVPSYSSHWVATPKRFRFPNYLQACNSYVSFQMIPCLLVGKEARFFVSCAATSSLRSKSYSLILIPTKKAVGSVLYALCGCENRVTMTMLRCTPKRSATVVASARFQPSFVRVWKIIFGLILTRSTSTNVPCA